MINSKLEWYHYVVPPILDRNSLGSLQPAGIHLNLMIKGWQWLTYTSFFRYAFESALVALYGDIGDGPRVLDECSRFNETLTTPNPSNPFPIRKLKYLFFRNAVKSKKCSSAPSRKEI